MEIITLGEVQRLGGSLLANGKLNFQDGVFVRGGDFPESSREFVLSMARKYRSCGIDCLLITSSGMITLWRSEKKLDRVELPPVPKPTIVHIDDSPLEGKIMAHIFSELSCEFVQVTNPMLAVASLLKVKPALILLDLNMPIVNGYEICAQLRRVESLKATPVVIVTGSDGLVDRVRAKMAGATDFLAKPIDRDKIVNIYNKYLSIK